VNPALVRLLVASDFHLGPLCRRFESRLGEDVVPLFLGDLLDRPREDAPVWERLVPRWERSNEDLVVVPGNHDPEDTGRWEGVQVHERRGLRILAVPVIPILYKIPSWTHEHSEARIAEMLDPWRDGTYDVIASHAPPYGICDRAAGGRSMGSRALRDFAADVDFRLWVCGHVHEQRGATGSLGGRPVHNAARTLLDLLVSVSPAAAATAAREGSVPRS
jgi:Icc-related predicted phosphoesterase